MQIGENIRKYRKELGFTQAQVAEYLGVTAPAVNKWETGSSCPDITLLPALARLLKTDLNTLLCFREELTHTEIGEFLNKVIETVQKEGYEAGYTMAEEKIQEYPTCGALLISAAMSLEGALLMYPDSLRKKREKTAIGTDIETDTETETDDMETLRKHYRKQLEVLYERAAESQDADIRNQANTMLLNRYMERKEYDKAQKLIDTFPKSMVDRQQMQARLWIEQGKKKEAQALLERQIMGEATAIQGKLIRLMELAEEEKEKERADFLAETARQTAGLYGLTEASRYMAHYGLALIRKDKKACMENLRLMLLGMEKVWKPTEFELYRHMERKEEKETTINPMLPGMIAELKRDKSLDFLREEEEFARLLEEFSGK